MVFLREEVMLWFRVANEVPEWHTVPPLALFRDGGGRMAAVAGKFMSILELTPSEHGKTHAVCRAFCCVIFSKL